MYNLGQYIHGNTLIYKLDPRIKIISVIALSIVVFKTNLAGSAIINAFMLALILLSRLSLHHILRALKPVAVIVTLLFVMHTFLTDGTALFTFAPFSITITYEGLYRGALVAWQIVCLILAAAVMTMTTTPSELISGIENLMRPLRRVGVPSHDIAVMISMALRFIPTLLEEFDKIRMAQMARGADIKTGSFLQKVKWAKSLAMPLMINAFRRADELSDAMESRGYQRGNKTTLRELRITSLDVAATALMVLFIGSFYITTGIFK
jgi:biotin transport system permease protein